MIKPFDFPFPAQKRLESLKDNLRVLREVASTLDASLATLNDGTAYCYLIEAKTALQATIHAAADEQEYLTTKSLEWQEKQNG